ncbi:hypothetical protein V2J09_014079 [Rumex salicifolius]
MAEAEAPIRFGILGCAEIAQKVSRAISLASADAVLYAVASRSIDKARAFAEANGFPVDAKVYGSYEELLDDPDVDAVYVPLPTALHLEWAVLAAQKKKHILLEKPVALNLSDLDRILEACESNGVQFMDGTMWFHHPRTTKMEEFLNDQRKFGRLINVQSINCFAAGENFLKNNIRMNPELDTLGALGDLGWYCIGATLWAANYQLPKFVTALRGTITNQAGVMLSCGASLHWEDGRVATFSCSFLAYSTMDITAVGTNGTLHVNDFVIPRDENVVSFSTASETSLKDLGTKWTHKPSEHSVFTDLPQEAFMVKEFSALVRNVKRNGSKPEMKWAILSRKTQTVIDAVKASIDKGYQPVEVVSCCA